MARQRGNGYLLLALAVAGLLFCWLPGKLAFLQESTELKNEALKVAKPWTQPHKIHVSHGGYELSSISQGKDQWHLTLAEEGEGPGLLASNLGGSITYAAEYDSTKSRHKLPIDGLRRAAFSAASKEFDADDTDWTLRVEGDRGSHFSATGDGSNFLYDASLGVEAAVRKDISAKYALDLKRRADASSALPNWVRQTVGLRYQSPVGKLKVNVQQVNPTSSESHLGYEAALEGDLTGPKIRGSPHFLLRAADGSYEAKLGLTGPRGLAGGLRLGYEGGKTTVSGHSEYAATKRLAKSVDVSVDAKVTATSAGDEVITLHPVGLTASTDLSSLLPSIADKGSSLDVRARYKLGSERPAVSVAAKLNNKRLAALQLAAEAAVDDAGTSSNRLSIRGSSKGVNAKYEALTAAGGATKHTAEVVYPVASQRGSAAAYGRLKQSSDEHNGKPRLQLGMEYDAGVTVAGRKLRVRGDSAAYDSGSQLLDESGLPWTSVRLNRIRQDAVTLRKKVEGSEGNSWVRK